MKSNPKKYIMGRLNLIAAYDNKLAYIFNSIKSNTIVDSKSNSYKYGIFNVDHIKFEEHDFLIGTLTKFIPTEDEEKVNIPLGTIDVNKDRNNVDAKSNFALHVKSGLIAFRPINNKISVHAFRNHFSEIIEKTNEGIFVEADIQIISEEIDIFHSLESFDVINRVNISLHPSNPSNRDIWKSLDDELHNSQVDVYNTYYKSERGLNIDEKGKIFSEISMAADGYGNAKIEGVENKKEKVASTDMLPVKFDVYEEDQEENNEIKKEKAINPYIFDKFVEIWKRMKS